jgi:Sec-independent protein translocase protein TatA
VIAFLNLGVAEIAVILVLAVMIFGKRLPQVAGETFRHVNRLRRHLDDLRRESGIDREIFDVKRTFRDAARDAEAEPTAARPYPGRPAWSSDRREAAPEAPDADAPAPERPDAADPPG